MKILLTNQDLLIACFDGYSPSEAVFLSRLLETGTTERSSAGTAASQIEEGSSQHIGSCDLKSKVKILRLADGNLHLKHKLLAGELHSHRDIDAKSEADLRNLRGDLETTAAGLEERNCKLAILKSERAEGKGEFLPLNLKNVKRICSSRPYLMLKDQLAKSKANVVQYHALYEKLQVEKGNLAWREKDTHIRKELVDFFHQASAIADSRIKDLEADIEKCIKEKNWIEKKMEEVPKEPGRIEIIAEFEGLIYSFPEEMCSMQNQFSRFKEDASDVHSLRADVKSLAHILDCKAMELEAFSLRSAEQNAEIQKLQAVVRGLKETISDLKLFREMYRCESTDSREVDEARNGEIKAWAYFRSLITSLDGQNLESQLKASIEAEVKSQQRLAAAEAEIGDLRQKLEASKRDKYRFSDDLKHEHEDTEAYLFEIESIGHAYDDIQSQNLQFLRQIAERDEYDMKGVQATQMRDALLMKKRYLERINCQNKATVRFYDTKAARIEYQLKSYADQIRRFSKIRARRTVTLENTQKRVLYVRKSSQQLRDTIEESQSKLDISTVSVAELQIELEKARFEKKRIEEDVETLRRKTKRLKLHSKVSSPTEKLLQELGEYKEILKCSICLDRSKEVFIAKCYHLFCSHCVQRVIETGQLKCPECAASFEASDVKPVEAKWKVYYRRRRNKIN
ncbi:E3 ubiquitin- ligase BRE1-like 1 [Olea europaea subsp. europaea]|uniref:E3 ubiquitin protein ligase n=1 Tax=Olea europaea subsp. europaea TaxID=158383 RepID=A0A8S0PMJ2_OLEEU|nr:E3 ubiquitin- ligase BRE1-like 1 [Olea europaea subsp. europaea]